MVGAVALNRPCSSPPPPRLILAAFFYPSTPVIAESRRIITLAAMSAPLQHKVLRAVAIFEAFKGAIVLVVGFGLLSFLSRDAEAFAERLVHRLHLDPANHYPQVFIKAMSDLTDTHLWLIASFAALYATVRFVEAYGLWHERRWAEWLAALGGAIYVPVELYELAHRVTALRVGALLVNLAVVAYMVWLLTESRRKHAAAAKAANAGPPPPA